MKATRWVNDNEFFLRNHDPGEVPSDLNDRARDNWRHLFTIADRLGGHWPETARRVAVTLRFDESDDEGSLSVLLLSDIKAAFAERKQDKLATANIIEYLTQLEDRPWGEYRRGYPLSGRSISNLLKGYSISPGPIRILTGTVKGYRREQFKEAWERYLPSPPS